VDQEHREPNWQRGKDLLFHRKSVNIKYPSKKNLYRASHNS
jgi:hypothetical protein